MSEATCECNLGRFENDKEDFTYCPICGKYLPKLFIGEQFLNTEEDTPLTELLRHLIYNCKKIKLKGKIVSPIERSDASLWVKIKDAICESNICLFDITEQRFNVGYELGYAIGERKSLLLCHSISKQKPSYFNQWYMYDSPDKIDTKSLVKTRIEIDEMRLPKEHVEKLLKLYISSEELYKKFNRMCEKFEQIFFEFDRQKNSAIHYRDLDNYQGDRFPSKNIVLITHKNLKNSLDSLIRSKGKSIDILSPEEITSFSSDASEIILNIHLNFLYKYRSMIGHLISITDVNDDEAKKHNFLVAFLGGLITHRDRKYCRFLANENNKIDTFSDRSPEKKYTTMEDAADKIVEFLDSTPK